MVGWKLIEFWARAFTAFPLYNLLAIGMGLLFIREADVQTFALIWMCGIGLASLLLVAFDQTANAVVLYLATMTSGVVVLITPIYFAALIVMSFRAGVAQW